MRTLELIKQDGSARNSLFKLRAATALGISVVADALDYFAAPFFGVPVIGDIFDAIIVSLLYNITRSKMSTAVNMIEFIPIVGDFIPVYTLSTLMWIAKEWKSNRKHIEAETRIK
ncbi:MAG TPA: hypothetical protein VLR10_02250 [Nitrososphaeraceae archaeon]|nr:hypothetical protein [Nitrososphaeraceae archaeon]